MPISINGSGTITGLSAGGLPDASITQADLASGVAGSGPAFYARLSSSVTLSSSTNTKITFGTEVFDTASCYDTSTSRFTPNVAGYYSISAALRLTGTSGACQFELGIYKNGSLYVPSNVNTTGANDAGHPGITALVYCNGTSDYLEIYANQNSTTSATSQGSSNFGPALATYFCGFLARAA
jgi:hypothetical protein